MASEDNQASASRTSGFSRFFKRSPRDDVEDNSSGISKWNLGILNDKQTIEVPGTVLLLASHRNRPLGLRNLPRRASHSSIPAGFPADVPDSHSGTETGRPAPSRNPSASSRPHTPYDDEHSSKKKTPDGAIILDPQPDDSANDPLNWQSWRRDIALLSLGFYCMVGGGTTPILAAGFTDVAEEYGIHVETVALTTGLYMMGMGLGSVIASPIAILYGKRPVYLVSAIIFIATSLWSGFSPSFESLLAARVFQGVAVSPVECLPSATIAEIFFLHERAYRIGIYTLLLLGGKNLVPLVSAAIIGRFGWRWVFFIISMIIALSGVLLFLFVPETFWDRTPTRRRSRRPSMVRRLSSRFGTQSHRNSISGPHTSNEAAGALASSEVVEGTSGASGPAASLPNDQELLDEHAPSHAEGAAVPQRRHHDLHVRLLETNKSSEQEKVASSDSDVTSSTPPVDHQVSGAGVLNPTQDYDNSRSSGDGDLSHTMDLDPEKMSTSDMGDLSRTMTYTHRLRQEPPQSFVQQLKPYHGRLNNDNFFKVMVRPFILFAYPAVLWSAVTYACSVGWLIVISETMAIIYRDPTVYNFDALQTGLVYISPFIGGILGTMVAGRVSDIVVRAMSRRNGGIYEPEFRLVMALPMLITTCVGLMGFGWSAEEKDHWMVPTIFFGIVSFGCSLGSTTSITFCVDSYRQYAGEALVTLNFSKNVLHGLVFSLFVTHWLADDGPKMVYIWIGIIQLICLLMTVPMYIYGKRARMWTVRKNFMEKF
ncbi:putative MFS-type transporter -like protein [Paramyrothecium foliicola]|nr:putative MFS-type transporter -like protein [Paramyrothecium foliicola]